MVPLQMGIKGAALGTGIGYLIPTVAGILFFTAGNTEFMGVAGVWLAVPIAELLTMVVALFFLYRIGNFVPYTIKKPSRGSHCGDMENVA